MKLTPLARAVAADIAVAAADGPAEDDLVHVQFDQVAAAVRHRCTPRAVENIVARLEQAGVVVWYRKPRGRGGLPGMSLAVDLRRFPSVEGGAA